MVKRPIVIATIGYIIGIILGLYFVNIVLFCIVGAPFAGIPVRHDTTVPFLCIIFLIVIITVILNNKIKRYFRILFPKKIVIIFCVSIIIGIVYVCFLNEKYEKIYEINNEIEVFGVIESKEEQQYGKKYIVRVESINNKRYVNTKLMLYTKMKAKELEYGDYIRLLAEYIKPEDSRNYRGFSYQNYLKQNMIYGTIKPLSEIQVIEKQKVNAISKITNNIKCNIIEEVNDNLSIDASSVFLGILLGEKSQITDEINSYFREGNMAHILAVSGAHVSYVMLIISILLGKFNKKFYLICTIIILVFFMILTNFAPSVVRACIMAIIALIAKLIYRKSDVYNNLGISALIILLHNPYTILNIGFQLTYLGTLGIIMLNKNVLHNVGAFIARPCVDKRLYHKINKFKKFIVNSILISLSVQILIAPIILFNFNMLSYNFLISTIIATPIFSGIMLVGIFTLILDPLKKICFPILQILLDSLIFISKFIASFPFSKIILSTPKVIWIFSYYIVVLVILFSKNSLTLRILKYREKINTILKKLVAVILAICIIFEFVQFFNNRDLRIFFIDVGQGDSTLIITPKNKVILIDGGGSLDKNYDVGKSVLVPYLLDREISKIDYIIVSHFDNDHVGGLMYVLKTLKVKNILISKQSEDSKEYKEFMELAKKERIKIIIVKQGDSIKIEKDITFNILYPASKLEFDDLNNNSIVTKMIYKDFSILFTGDIEMEAEDKILKKYNQDTLKSTVLKVAHHGSKTSTTEEFINSVNPKITLIGVGKNNNFGHPNEEVLDRIENSGAKIYRTDEAGEISLKVNKEGRIWINRMLN